MSDNEIKKTSVDLGCGQNKREGFLGVDAIETEEADIIQDLDEQEWMLPKNHFENVVAQDIFEHLENPIQFMENINRICKEDAEIYIRSPHLCSRNWIDPTHKRLVGITTFEKFFTREGHFYSKESEFEIIERRITFRREVYLPWNFVIEPLVNYNRFTQWFYEVSPLGSIFPSLDVEVRLKAI